MTKPGQCANTTGPLTKPFLYWRNSMAEKYSTLTQERLKELLHYDPLTGLFTRKCTRGNSRSGSTIGGHSCHGYRMVEIDGRKYGLHRMAWLYCYNDLPDCHIDHINGIRHDNRIENLRKATKSENLQNQRKPSSNNKSGFLGVSKHGNKWRATITYGGTFHRLGAFKTPEEAHAAYISEKRKHHAFCTI